MNREPVVETGVGRTRTEIYSGGPVVALQVEIGASTVKCKDMMNKLKMVKHMKNTENGLLKAVVERMVLEGSGGWIKQVEEYMHAVSFAGVSFAWWYQGDP